MDYSQQLEALIEFGREAHHRNWVPATSGNLSARVDEEFSVVTISGSHVGHLSKSDFIVIDRYGLPQESHARPSAEAFLHAMIYRNHPDAGAVLHTHSPRATAMSMMETPCVRFKGYEVLKAFPGIDTHETQLNVPIYDNDQDVAGLADHIEAADAIEYPAPAFLIAGHGTYTWGSDVADAANHVEALEFLFECEMLRSFMHERAADLF